MSAVTKPSQQSSEPTAKKKFGKNLNKLTKPPAPPVTTGAKSSASSRNGLLLLSTKRPSGSNTASAEAGPKCGILSNKSQVAAKPLPSLGLQYESNTSTHDALLGAVVGASRSEAQQQPDAWGVAEKHQKAVPDELPIGQAHVEPAPDQTTLDQGNRDKDAEHPQSKLDRLGLESRYEAQSSRSDDVGSRKNLGENNGVISGHGYGDLQQRGMMGEDVQGLFMSRVAQERAEKRRLEEEMRVTRQKERSAQKLRELEERMMTSSANVNLSQEKADLVSGQTSEGLKGRPQQTSKVILEKLNRSGSNSGGAPHQQVASPEDNRTSSRSLFDPNRTYSSLVGGGAAKEIKISEAKPTEAEVGSQSRNGRPSGHYAPATEAPSPQTDVNQYSRQVIHLSSYEDRDRGERASSAVPRMLYDPKSGSMVAVPSRDESGSGGRRKERGKKGRTGRDKDSFPRSDARQDTVGADGPKSGRKGKARKDENGKRCEASPSKAENKKGRVINSKRKLPRTCGVLYARDEKGGLFCADGCDGDVGYGAHSVPGGRNKNPDAYAKVVEGQKQLFQQEEPAGFDEQIFESSYGTTHRANESNPSVTLQTGFSLSEPKEAKLDWVKPNEKIVLVTGVDDSPTLQATAKEWAPSQAALAAAAAAIEQEKSAAAMSVGSVDGHLDEDTDDEPPFGLGFDPTLNMDSVMQSPSPGPSRLDAVDLASLSLEPALKTTTNSHIFAFESGATWGASSGSGSNDWGLPSTGKVFSSDGQTGSVGPATFLSLSSAGTWGAPSVPGLKVTPLSGASLNGEHSRSTGD